MKMNSLDRFLTEEKAPENSYALLRLTPSGPVMVKNVKGKNAVVALKSAGYKSYPLTPAISLLMAKMVVNVKKHYISNIALSEEGILAIRDDKDTLLNSNDFLTGDLKKKIQKSVDSMPNEKKEDIEEDAMLKMVLYCEAKELEETEQVSKEEIKKAFSMLQTGLGKKELEVNKTGMKRYVDNSEFDFMGKAKGHYQFKHKLSRNYVFIDEKTGNMVVPKSDKPFMHGYFPAGPEQMKAVPHEISSELGELERLVRRLKMAVEKDAISGAYNHSKKIIELSTKMHEAAKKAWEK